MSMREWLAPQASRLSIRNDGQDARPTGNLVGAHGDAPFLDPRLHGNDRRLFPSFFNGVAMTICGHS